MIEKVLLIAESCSIYMPLIIAGYLSFSFMKIPYFSIETSFVTGAIIASKMLASTQGFSHVLALLAVCIAGIAGGCIIGVITGCLTTFGNIPHLLANVLTLGIGYGLNLFLLNGSYQSLAPMKNYLILMPNIKNPELLALACISCGILCIVFLFLKTQVGICIKMYGNNPLFFKYHGISTSYIVLFGEIAASGLAGLSGYFVAQSSGFIDINAGNGLTLFCLTALILGKTCTPSRFSDSLIIPIAGLIIYSLLQQIILESGFDLKYFTLAQSLIITALLIKKYRQSEQISSSETLGV